MGALCSCCKGGHGVLGDDQVEMTKPQRAAGQPPQQRRKRVSKAETEEDRAKAAEAKRNAGLAAQQRQEAFEKTAAGRARRKIAEELAKPAPPPSRGEPALRDETTMSFQRWSPPEYIEYQPQAASSQAFTGEEVGRKAPTLPEFSIGEKFVD